MKRKRFTDEQKIRIVKESEAGAKTQDLCRRHGISPQTFYNWRKRFGGMTVEDSRRLAKLEAENRELKQMVAELSLDKKALERLLEGNW